MQATCERIQKENRWHEAKTSCESKNLIFFAFLNFRIRFTRDSQENSRISAKLAADRALWDPQICGEAFAQVGFCAEIEMTAERLLLFYFYGSVSEHSKVNSMDATNLAIIWGACLFLKSMDESPNKDIDFYNRFVLTLIENCAEIFE